MYVQKTFTFKIKKRKKDKNINKFEDVFLSSIPSDFNISIQDSMINVISQSIDSYTKSLNDVALTLDRITKSLQIASCNIKDLVGNLKKYQKIADDFAKNNNNTKIYYRQIGLDGNFLNNKESFLMELNRIITDTGEEYGKLPLITPASIYADSNIIYHALIDDDTNPISKLYGAGKLSNHYQLKDGFYTNEINYNNIQIKIKDNKMYIILDYINNYKNLIGKKIEIKNDNYGGLYIISDVNITKDKKVIVEILYNNQFNVEFVGSVVIYSGNKISTKEKIERALQIKDKTQKIPITTVVDILIKNNIICMDKNNYNRDKAIALDRLSRYTNTHNNRVGGILFVGGEKDIMRLIMRLDMLSDIFYPLKYTLENLKSKVILNDVLKDKSLTNINYSNNNFKFNKFNKDNNVGLLDAKKALEDVKNSNVLNWEMPKLKEFNDHKDDYDFNKWRYFSVVELIPQLNILNKIENTFNKIGIGYSMTINSIGDLISIGQNSLNELVQSVESNINAASSIIDKLNNAYSEVESFLNQYKKRVSYGASTLKVITIGKNEQLLSNYDFYNKCVEYINNKNDTNNPFNNKNYTIYYGFIFFVVGDNDKDLYSKIEFLSNLMSINK